MRGGGLEEDFDEERKRDKRKAGRKEEQKIRQ